MQKQKEISIWNGERYAPKKTNHTQARSIDVHTTCAEVRKSSLGARMKKRTATLWQALSNGEKIKVDTNFDILPAHVHQVIDVHVDCYVPDQYSIPVPALEDPNKVRPSACLVEMSFRKNLLVIVVKLI